MMVCLITSAAFLTASPGLRTARLRMSHTCSGYTIVDHPLMKDPAYLSFQPHLWHLANPVMERKKQSVVILDITKATSFF